ncbi:PAS domain-containing protein [candidate division KSB1 bacterium]|nr:MAG: PAS domain-containing protein [candidate division KSB1 bacterium]RPH96541.1 MAG: PAS domain-containing protein [candidate division KSB1 bacterium]
MAQSDSINNSLWLDNAPFAATVCDKAGIIQYMNRKACETFASDGGEKLIGTNVLDCHPEPSRTKVLDMLERGESNIYTIEKNGVKKLIYQMPRIEHGKLCGLVELSLEIPFDMPHFIRKNS